MHASLEMINTVAFCEGSPIPSSGTFCGLVIPHRATPLPTERLELRAIPEDARNEPKDPSLVPMETAKAANRGSLIYDSSSTDQNGISAKRMKSKDIKV